MRCFYNQIGRSMIEMLGVLAIIAVLSVGGIAGYSKAMEQFKANKLIEEYNLLIAGLIEYKSGFPIVKGYDTYIASTIMSLNLVPSTWKLIGSYLDDNRGNLLFIRAKFASSLNGLPVIVADFNLGGLKNDVSERFSIITCQNIFNKIIIPLHSTLSLGYVYLNGAGHDMYYGDGYCSGKLKCIRDMSLNDVKNICSSCDAKRRCNVTITF